MTPTVSLLGSGVGLGAYVPLLLLARDVRARGAEVEVLVIEQLYGTAGLDALERHRLAYHRDFRVARMSHRMTRPIDASLEAAAVAALIERWRRHGRRWFVVASGFWLPILAAYRTQLGARIHVELLRLDAVPSASVAVHDEHAHTLADALHEVWLVNGSKGRIENRVAVSSAPPRSWEDRQPRCLVHGGGWGIGTYLDRLPAIEASGLALDVVIHEAVDVRARGGRAFMIDPSWRPWHEGAGFPPFADVSDPASTPTFVTGTDHHESFDLVARAVAVISKPGGGTLIDSLCAATPLVLLEPYGYAEAANAKIWTELGLGITFERWADTGFDVEVLRRLHINACALRRRAPDYATRLAGRLASETATWNGVRSQLMRARSGPTLETSSAGQAAPLSPTQRLFAATTHSLVLCFVFDFAVDVDLIERSLATIVRRHEVLHTAMRGKLAVVLPPEVVGLERADAPVFEVLELARAAAFDPSVGPLVAFTWVRDATEQALVMRVHHCAFDGLSTTVFLRELGIVYSALADGRPVPLAPLQHRFADYSRWCAAREALQVETAMPYWRATLATSGPRLPAHWRSSGIMRGHDVAIPASLVTALAELGTRYGATLFMTALAGFKLLWARCTDVFDLMVHTALAGRHHPALREHIGCFIEPVGLRTRLTHELSLGVVIERVRDTCNGAFAHAELPIDTCGRALLRDKVVWPLRVLFMLHEPTLVLEIHGRRIRPREEDGGSSGVGLSLSLHRLGPEDGGLLARWRVEAATLDAEALARFGDLYLDVLRTMIDDPELALSAIDVGSSLPALGERLRPLVDCAWRVGDRGHN